VRHSSCFFRYAAGILLSLSSALATGQTAPLVALRLSKQPTSTEPQTNLQNSLGARPASSTLLGHLDSSTRLTGLSLILKRTPDQEAALTKLLHDLQDPASPSYHQWLTPQSFGDRFGLAQVDLDVLTKWLQSQGFVVTEIAPSRNRIVFSGTGAQVEVAFGLTLGRYRRDGQTFFENSSPVRLPQSLSAVVSGVTGLSSYHLKSHALSRPRSAVIPQFTTASGSHYLVPWDFRQIYDINTLINAGSDGTGIKIGVIGQSAIDTTQLSYFQQKTGQAAKLPTIVLVPNTGFSNLVQGDDDESELDLEYSSGSAPGASIEFIYTGCGTTPSSAELSGTTDCQNDGVNTALIYAVTNNLAPILTVSYGACEATIAAYAQATLEPVLEQANAQGQTVLASSGDSGPATCDQGINAVAASHGLSVSYPASSAYVTSVGGTEITGAGWSTTNNGYGGSAPGYLSENPWNDTSNYGELAASGGGVSKIFQKPTWQVGTNVPSDLYRDVPDVAFAASVLAVPYLACTTEAPCVNGNPFAGSMTLADGGFYGGTSLSAPGFAAMLAVIEQANSSGPLGNVNPKLYALAEGSSAKKIFHSIGGGDNVVPCVFGTTDCGSTNTSRTIGYFINTGYDQVDGLGSISASGFAAGLSAKTLPMSLSISPQPAIVGQPVTLTATVIGSDPTPTGSVMFSVSGTAVSSAVSLTNGVATFNYSGFTSPAELALVQADYSGDSTYGAASSSFSTPVDTAPVTLSITASGTPLQTNAATNIAITATGAYGAPTGSISLMIDGVSVGTGLTSLPLVNGVATYSYSGFTSAGLHLISASYNGSSTQSTYYYGTARTSLEVTSSSQTLTPVVTLTYATPSPLAPSDSVGATFLVASQAGVVPTGRFSYTIDGLPTTNPATTVNGPAGLTVQLGLGAYQWAPGTHTFQFIYGGDDHFKPSAPVTASYTVISPSFTLAVSPSTLTVPNGGSGSATLTVNAGPTYAESTSFKLALLSYTGTAFSGCFGLSSLDPTSQRGSPTSVTLTVYSGTSHCTSTNHIDVLSASNTRNQRSGFGVVFAASVGIIGFFALRRRQFIARLLFMIVSITLLAAMGCSGDSNKGAPTSGTSSTGTATPPSVTGTYQLEVFGTSADRLETATANFTLVIE
jgi:hypothetical protein